MENTVRETIEWVLREDPTEKGTGAQLPKDPGTLSQQEDLAQRS